MKGSFAIVFGDIIEFSRLVKLYKNIDELKSRYKSIIYTSCEKHKGEVLDFFTDSVKIVFKEANDALGFALEVQQKFEHGQRIPYRISIAYGEVEYDDDGIFGESAQIASRLLNLCSDGAVLFPGNVAQKAKENKQFEINHIGRTYLKDLEDGFEIYCLANEGVYAPSDMELFEKKQHSVSIAVLPFHNTSSEGELEYICDGIAEDVIDSLTKQKDLHVTARSSSFVFKNKDVTILEISRKLNVGYVLDGSIRKRGDNYRISYQLVDSLTGYNLLSNSLDSDFNNLYNAEKTIVKDLLGQFEFKEEEPEAEQEYYIDPVAYNYFLKGKHLAFQWKKQEAFDAIECFKKALEIIPDYSLAFAGLSYSYVHCALSQFMDYGTAMTNAVQYADKAIKADESRHEGYLAKALASFWKGFWYVPDFDENISKALNISPCNAEIRMFNGMLYLLKKNDLENATNELKLAHELDPYSKLVIIRLGLVQYLKRDYKDAYNTFTTILKDTEYRSYSSIRLAWCSYMMKDYELAIHHLKNEHKEYEYYNMVYGAFLAIYHDMKDEDNFFKYKKLIEDLPETEPTYYYNHSVLNKVLGKAELSIEYITKAMQNPMMLFMFIHLDEFWEEYYEHPDFIALIDEKYNKGKKKQLKINSETKEFVELNPDEFLYAEAQDNYTLIVWKENKKVAEKLLRATLSFVENQLELPEIVRCHRSYLVNSNSEYYYCKSDNRAFLKHQKLDFEIPVSRSNEKEMKEIFRK